MEIERTYYTHDAECDLKPESFTPLNTHGVKTCLQCAGVFKEDGKTGVATTDKRFDKNYVAPPEES